MNLCCKSLPILLNQKKNTTNHVYNNKEWSYRKLEYNGKPR
jgi:hypothetical protein